MPDNATSSGGFSGLLISDDIRARFPELIELITHSESMNDGERQYWIDLLPVMTEEQVTQLRGILQNEREQLAAIDAKYGKQPEVEEGKRSLKDIEEDRRAKMQQRAAEERRHLAGESQSADDILKDIQES